MVAYTFNPSTREAKEVRSTERIPGQPHRETKNQNHTHKKSAHTYGVCVSVGGVHINVCVPVLWSTRGGQRTMSKSQVSPSWGSY